MDESDKTLPGDNNGFDWRDKLGVLVLVGIIAVVYGLISNDWEFAVGPVLGCVLWIVVSAAFNRLRRMIRQRRAARHPVEQPRAEDAPPVE